VSTSVRVPVGVALCGDLPPVCCMTGAPADGRAPVVVPKRLGVAWLLLLGGPIGVALLVALWPRLRVRYVVRLPMSDAAFERMHLLAVRRLWCGWLGALGLVVSFGLWWLPPLAVVVAVASVCALGVSVRAHVALPWTRPSAVVDARGRSVVLRGVHPAFAAAAAAAGIAEPSAS
jgi:hypothetical protein